MNLHNLLEEINYGKRNPEDVDSKLLFMAVKQHLSDPNNFRTMMNKPHRTYGNYTRIRDMPNINPELRNKYGDLKITFSTNHPDYPDAKGLYWGGRHKLIGLPGMNSLHPDYLENNHINDVHHKFMRELHNKYLDFRHELKHHMDEKAGKFTDPSSMIGGDQPEKYYNHPSEMSAILHEKEHHIERTLLQNNHFGGNATPGEYSPRTKTHLPLRQRIYHSKNFADMLSTVDEHTLGDHTLSHRHWYDNLSPGNKFKAHAKLMPIIKKYMIANPGI